MVASQNEVPQITTATHDLNTDEYLILTPLKIKNDSIIITDGAYLFKPNYQTHWDYKVYLKTDFKTALLRGIKRDTEFLGGPQATKDKFEKRYHSVSKMNIKKINPEELADIIIDNTDFENLKIVK